MPGAGDPGEDAASGGRVWGGFLKLHLSSNEPGGRPFADRGQQAGRAHRMPTLAPRALVPTRPLTTVLSTPSPAASA